MTYTFDDGRSWGDTEKAVETNLLNWLTGQIATYSTEPFNFVPQAEGAKWLASSAMQKSIRRGDVETAKKMAEAIIHLEPRYFWRRVRVVMCEDIGCAHLPLVGAFFAICGKTKARAKLADEITWAHWFAEQMAQSPKDRSADDLNLVAHADMFLAGKAVWVADMDLSKRAHLAKRTNHVPLRTIALTSISGWMPLHQSLTQGRQYEVAGNLKTFIQVASDTLGIPPLVQFIVRRAQGNGTPFHLTLPVVWHLAQQDPHVRVQTAPVDRQFVGPWPAAAIDTHNRPGKRAIAHWWRRAPEIADYIERESVPDWANAAMGVAVFKAEGVARDQRLVFERAHEIERISTQNILSVEGHADSHVDHVFKLVRRNLDTLHDARATILGENRA